MWRRDSDIVAGQFGGSSAVRVFDLSGQMLSQMTIYESSFFWGVNVSIADFNTDGVTDLIVGAGIGGGPRVRVFTGANGGVLAEIGNGFSFDSVTVYVGTIRLEASRAAITTRITAPL